MSDSDEVLDDPVGESLRGTHAHLARRHGRALTYQADVATFVAVPREHTPASWADLARLLGPGGFADMFTSPAEPPEAWQPAFTMSGVQMVADAVMLPRSVRDSRVVDLGEDDVDEMLSLAAATQPGPFWPRTRELGTYVGVRHGGRLVAMAGERLRPPGWTEVSAVCTLPDFRGLGLATRLVRALVIGIVARGERPFLHVSSENTSAIALYQHLGFTIRRRVTFRGFRVPPA